MNPGAIRSGSHQVHDFINTADVFFHISSQRPVGATNDECDMECGDLSPLFFRRPGHSGDKSPHSKKIVIVHLHLTKAEPEATRASNCTHAKKPSPSGE